MCIPPTRPHPSSCPIVTFQTKRTDKPVFRHRLVTSLFPFEQPSEGSSGLVLALKSRTARSSFAHSSQGPTSVGIVYRTASLKHKRKKERKRQICHQRRQQIPGANCLTRGHCEILSSITSPSFPGVHDQSLFPSGPSQIKK